MELLHEVWASGRDLSQATDDERTVLVAEILNLAEAASLALDT
jgi:hypothetical protein